MTAPVVSIFDVGDYDEQIGRAVTLLHEGGVVVLPTETIYGAAGALTHPKALDRLKAIRGHAGAGKPFTIHLARREQAMRYIGETNENAQRLMKKLWPGPVALQFDVPAAATGRGGEADGRRRKRDLRFGRHDRSPVPGSHRRDGPAVASRRIRSSSPPPAERRWRCSTKPISRSTLGPTRLTSRRRC
jgi:hypothetical protein